MVIFSTVSHTFTCGTSFLSLNAQRAASTTFFLILPFAKIIFHVNFMLWYGLLGCCCSFAASFWSLKQRNKGSVSNCFKVVSVKET